MEELKQWYNSNIGQRVLLVEKQCLQNILPNLFGYHLLQLGAHISLQWLPSSHISHRCGLAPSLPHATTGDFATEAWIESNFEELPLRAASMDAVIVPHLLECSPQPLSVLQEISRVLLAEGNLLLFGFNPWHPWYWWRKPKNLNALAPWQAKQLLKRADLMLTEIQWLHYGAIYFMRAQKHVYCVTPIKPRWAHKVIEKEFAQPSVRKIGMSCDKNH